MAKKKLLIAAMLVGTFAALLFFLYAAQMQEREQELRADEVAVVKASREIPAGTPLTKDRITTELIPKRFLPPTALMKSDLELYVGQNVASNIKEGAMILASDFSVVEAARTLSGRIPAGERAMSVPVDAVSGVSGLLRPGDRVDVLGTFPVGTQDEVIPEAGGRESVGYVTMTLLQNVTLLAVGQEISDVASSEAQRQQRGAYSTITMSVTIDEAELIVIAQTRGKLNMLLRNREDLEIGSVKRKTLRQVLQDLEVLNTARIERADVKRPTRSAPAKPAEPGIEILRGK